MYLYNYSPSLQINNLLELLSFSLSPSLLSLPPSSSMGVTGEQAAWSKGGMGNDVSRLRQNLRRTFTFLLTKRSLRSTSLHSNQICISSDEPLNFPLLLDFERSRNVWMP
ncbi:hypothetical protein ATANTOWER_016781 [Ataeniobius toweri]|uniref:Uncharacterized protein n=1 Tax=Ataeniobius toweri TaxID=208326 RepID=A0ABU7AFM7_9TELE|nr:hypothetical protein [Ataeniobius toweri]